VGGPVARPGTLLLDLFVLDQLADALLRDVSERHGLQPGEFAVASVINGVGPITPTQLAERLGLPPTTISSRLMRLERRGHVRRRPNPRDGRSSLMETTEEGRRALEGIIPGLRAAHAAIARNLDGTLDDMRDRLAPLIAAIRAAVDEGAASS
jgi:DNA-binding MarR family transcriptional regulator